MSNLFASRTLLITIIAFAVTGNAQPTSPGCFVELPVFDPLGVKVPFEIIEIRAQQNDGSDLLKVRRKTGHVSESMTGCTFPRTGSRMASHMSRSKPLSKKS
jgi:hypothetical protein